MPIPGEYEMSPQGAIVAILGALLLGVMSPGPSFIVVARNSINLSRRAGLAAALGMGIGGVAFSGIALLGLFTLLARVEMALRVSQAGRRTLPAVSRLPDVAWRGIPAFP
jgi:hypothetical protein